MRKFSRVEEGRSALRVIYLVLEWARLTAGLTDEAEIAQLEIALELQASLDAVISRDGEALGRLAGFVRREALNLLGKFGLSQDEALALARVYAQAEREERQAERDRNRAQRDRRLARQGQTAPQAGRSQRPTKARPAAKPTGQVRDGNRRPVEGRTERARRTANT